MKLESQGRRAALPCAHGQRLHPRPCADRRRCGPSSCRWRSSAPAPPAWSWPPSCTAPRARSWPTGSTASIADKDIQVSVIEAADRVLPALPPRLSAGDRGAAAQAGRRRAHRRQGGRGAARRRAPGRRAHAAGRAGGVGGRREGAGLPEGHRRPGDQPHQPARRAADAADHARRRHLRASATARPAPGPRPTAARAAGAAARAGGAPAGLARRRRRSGARLARQAAASDYRYRDFGSLVSLGEFSTVGNMMGGLIGGSLMVEGVFARLMYLSLYKMHELALHGSVEGGARHAGAPDHAAHRAARQAALKASHARMTQDPSKHPSPLTAHSPTCQRRMVDCGCRLDRPRAAGGRAGASASPARPGARTRASRCWRTPMRLRPICWTGAAGRAARRAQQGADGTFAAPGGRRDEPGQLPRDQPRGDAARARQRRRQPGRRACACSCGDLAQGPHLDDRRRGLRGRPQRRDHAGQRRVRERADAADPVRADAPRRCTSGRC